MIKVSGFESIDVAKLGVGEVLGAFSYALDLAEGQLPGHCKRSCFIGMAIAAEMGLPEERVFDLSCALLMKDLGGSSNSARICQLFSTDDRTFKRNQKLVGRSSRQVLSFAMKNTAPSQPLGQRIKVAAGILNDTGDIARDLFETRSQNGADIAQSMGFSDVVVQGIASLNEHWDGGGHPYALNGDTIPLFSRIALISQVIDVFNTASGKEVALAAVVDRSGTWFDPNLVHAAQSVGAKPEFWQNLARPDLDVRLFATDTAQNQRYLTDEHFDKICAGFARVVDEKSPFTRGHSARVALYSDMLAEAFGYDTTHRKWLECTGLLHDVGKLGISNTILDKPGGLTHEEYAAVKQHPKMGEEIIGRVAALQPIAKVAVAHSERLDGKGYPYGIGTDELTRDMRILSVADVFDALSADRPYRAALPLGQVFSIMDKMCGSALDGEIAKMLKEAIEGNPALEFRKSA